MISSYHISRSKCLAWVERLRDDDRHDLLTSVWTKIIDCNHHHWSVLVIQIFISSIYLTEDSWYTTSRHRNYRWGPYSDLQIVWSGHQKKVTFCVNYDNDIALICFLYRFHLSIYRDLVMWLSVSRKTFVHGSQIQIEHSHCSCDWLDDDGRDEKSTLIISDVYWDCCQILTILSLTRVSHFRVSYVSR